MGEKYEMTVTFQPGALGIKHANWDTGVLHELDPGGQADKKGVRCGYRFKAIDRMQYSEALLDTKRQGDKEFVVIFLTHERRLDTMLGRPVTYQQMVRHHHEDLHELEAHQKGGKSVNRCYWNTLAFYEEDLVIIP